MIRVRDVRKSFGQHHVLAGVTLDIPRGQILALFGPSGAGKSVLLKSIVGLLTPDSGGIVVDGVSVPGASYGELRALRRRMGYVFQDGALLDSLTIRENLALALDDAECERNPDYCPRRVRQALATVNLKESILDRLPAEVSGGMRKRVGVARALMNEPEIILYDEPTTGLDPRNVAAIADVVLNARRRFDATSIVVSHDLEAIGGVADRVALLCDGLIHFDDAPEAFFGSDDPVILRFRGKLPATETEAA